MKNILRSIGALTFLVSATQAGFAQPLSASLQTAAACAPLAETAAPIPLDALRLIGAQDSVGRALFGPGDLVIVGGGTGEGVQLGQQFVVRRLSAGHGNTGLRALNTIGRVRVVAVNDSTTIGLVEVSCDGLLTGDYLVPYNATPLPPDAGRTDTSGEPDFSNPGRILFGDNERSTASAGEFVITDIGTDRGAAPGLRLAIYRDVRVPGLPLNVVGEAIVISAAADTSVVRLTLTRDAIYSGDLLVPRRK
jgi:hypothetical protein